MSNPYQIGTFEYRAHDRLVSMRATFNLDPDQLRHLLDEVGVTHRDLIAEAVARAEDDFREIVDMVKQERDEAINLIPTGIEKALRVHGDEIAKTASEFIAKEVGL